MTEAPAGEGRDAGLVTLEFGRGERPLGQGLPDISSEAGWVLRLVTLSPTPWTVVRLNTCALNSFTRLGIDRQSLPWAWLAEQEVLRLERLHALKLLAKVSAAPRTYCGQAGKGLGKRARGGRGRGSRRA